MCSFILVTVLYEFCVWHSLVHVKIFTSYFLVVSSFQGLPKYGIKWVRKRSIVTLILSILVLYLLVRIVYLSLSGKGIIRTSGLTQQQLLLLRQQALQQQQAQLQAHRQQQQQQSSSQVAQPLQKQPHPTLAASQSPAILPPVGKQPSVQLSQKLQLPTNIEQLRPTIALQSSRTVPSAATLIKAGLHTRSMQTEEVLALLRQQQSYRLAVTTTKLSQIQQQLAAKASASPHLTLGGEPIPQVVTPQLSIPKPSVVAPAESVKTSEQETAQLKVERVDQALLQKLSSQHTLLKKGDSEWLQAFVYSAGRNLCPFCLHQAAFESTVPSFLCVIIVYDYSICILVVSKVSYSW